MSTDQVKTPDRRMRTRQMVDKWMTERQQMLVLYCQLAGLEPYTPDRSSKDLLRQFCQVMVDYIAFGHFEVYNRIGQGEERRLGPRHRQGTEGRRPAGDRGAL